MDMVLLWLTVYGLVSSSLPGGPFLSQGVCDPNLLVGDDGESYLEGRPCQDLLSVFVAANLPIETKMGVQPARSSLPAHRERCLAVRCVAPRKLIRPRPLGACTPLRAFDRFPQSPPIAAEPLIKNADVNTQVEVSRHEELRQPSDNSR